MFFFKISLINKFNTVLIIKNSSIIEIFLNYTPQFNFFPLFFKLNKKIPLKLTHKLSRSVKFLFFKKMLNYLNKEKTLKTREFEEDFFLFNSYFYSIRIAHF